MSFSVKDPAYGAKGDAKQVADGVIASGSNQLHSATAHWSIADVGKTIWCVDNSTTALTGQTTITGYTSPTQVTVGVNAAHGSSTPCEVTWGTDDTAAFLAAYAASRLDTTTSFYPTIGGCGTVFIPAGGYIVTSKFYTHVGTGGTPFNLIGEHKSNTIIFPSPAFTPIDNFSPIWISVLGGVGEISGFTIIGPDFLYPLYQNTALIDVQFSTIAVDFNVRKVGATSYPAASNWVVNFANSSVRGSLLVQNGGPDLAHTSLNLMIAARFLSCFGSMDECLLSNMYANLLLDSCTSRLGVGNPANGLQMLNFFGGIVDEPVGSNSVQLINGSSVNFNGTTLWASSGSGYHSAYVDGTSKLFLTSCDLGCYEIGDFGTKALLIDVGGVAQASNTSFRSESLSSPVAIENNGKFVDAGGNYALSGGTGSNLPVPWLQAFSNPAQVWRS